MITLKNGIAVEGRRRQRKNWWGEGGVIEQKKMAYLRVVGHVESWNCNERWTDSV